MRRLPAQSRMAQQPVRAAGMSAPRPQSPIQPFSGRFQRGNTLHPADGSHDPVRSGFSRLPAIIRTADDIRTLLANSREVRKLPKNGIAVAIDGLDRSSAEKLQARILAYIRACGCATGGAVAIASLSVLLIAMTLQISQRGVRWIDLFEGAMGLLGTMLLAGLGKLLGVVVARLRFERCCRDVVRILAKDHDGRAAA